MNLDTKGPLLVAAVLAALAAPTSGGIFIYEPFEYEPTTEVNDGRYFGDGNQAGGLGLGQWTQRDNPGNVPPINEGDVADEGVTFTDSLGNVLPVAGNAYERRQRVGQVSCSSPIDKGATLALTADNSTMWMSFLFQDFGFSGPDFGIGMHSEKMVGNDNQDLEAAGFGVGFHITSTGGQSRNIQTAVYNNATSATLVSELTPTFNGPAGSDVFLLAMKVNWNESGTPDEIFAFIIDDITTEPDEADALAMDTFDFDLATQQSLDFFNFSDTQVGYVDEIRVGTSFSDVTTGVPSLPLEITAFDFDPDAETVQLTWRSRPGRTYVAKSSETLDDGWEADLGDGLSPDDDEIPDDGDLITVTFNLADFFLDEATDLFFRIEEE